MSLSKIKDSARATFYKKCLPTKSSDFGVRHKQRLCLQMKFKKFHRDIRVANVSGEILTPDLGLTQNTCYPYTKNSFQEFL